MTQAEPWEQKYRRHRDASIPREANGSIMSKTISGDYYTGTWNQAYLHLLFKNELMLTSNIAYTMMGDRRYPNGIPSKAPRPGYDEPDLWPEDTWVIWKDI